MILHRGGWYICAHPSVWKQWCIYAHCVLEFGSVFNIYGMCEGSIFATYQGKLFSACLRYLNNLLCCCLKNMYAVVEPRVGALMWRTSGKGLRLVKHQFQNSRLNVCAGMGMGGEGLIVLFLNIPLLFHQMGLPTVSTFDGILPSQIAFSSAVDDFMRKWGEGTGSEQAQEKLSSSNSAWKHKADLN